MSIDLNRYSIIKMLVRSCMIWQNNIRYLSLNNVGIIGMGNLGKSLASMILSHSNRSVITNPRGKAHLFPSSRFHTLDRNKAVASNSDVLILSTKPTQIREVCMEIQPILNPKIPIISTAAAIKLQYLQQWLPDSEIIIRCMPNVPCSMGEGVVPYYSNHDLAMEIMRTIFSPNRIISMDNDDQIDLSTVITGCAPAFLAWFSQRLIEISQRPIEISPRPTEISQRPTEINQDISPELLQIMIAQTVQGTGSLMMLKSNHDIIREVASPGGATEIGVKLLDNTSNDILNAFDASLKRIQAVDINLQK